MKNKSKAAEHCNIFNLTRAMKKGQFMVLRRLNIFQVIWKAMAVYVEENMSHYYQKLIYYGSKNNDNRKAKEFMEVIVYHLCRLYMGS